MVQWFGGAKLASPTDFNTGF